ncbi:hypothetical protein [Aestuariivirga sp.]|uniref:hypothetical protein n=1 Tax=Aestuariivirga sp. TaxID=2650926 RepID=UPI00359378D8
MTKLLIVGDSHIYALREALETKPELPDGVSIELLRNASEKNGTIIGDITVDDAVKRAAALTAGDLLVTHYRGNQYNTLGLIQHPRPFDFVMQSVDGGKLQPGAEVIPLQMMRKYFADTLRGGYGKIMLRLKAACPVRMVCITPPAPKEDNAHIVEGAETYFKQHGISDIGVTPAPVRLKLWTLQQQALAEFCKENGMIFLGNPTSARDQEGYLRRRYYAEDATHANAAYGVMVLRQLVDILLQDAISAV